MLLFFKLHSYLSIQNQKVKKKQKKNNFYSILGSSSEVTLSNAYLFIYIWMFYLQEEVTIQVKGQIKK